MVTKVLVVVLVVIVLVHLILSMDQHIKSQSVQVVVERPEQEALPEALEAYLVLTHVVAVLLEQKSNRPVVGVQTLLVDQAEDKEKVELQLLEILHQHVLHKEILVELVQARVVAAVELAVLEDLMQAPVHLLVVV